jgi:transcriptional regulator with XRE-family HTH domain
MSMNSEINHHIGRRIRQRRVALGLSQHALAESIGVTFQQVQKYEKGANSVSTARLYQIAQALQVHIPFFLEEYDSKLKTKITEERLSTEMASDRELLEMAKTFYQIKDHSIRKSLRNFMRCLVEN